MNVYKMRKQAIAYKDGFRGWETLEEMVSWNAAETAVIIVDMWDKHWSTGATKRGAVLADKINALVQRARRQGILIVHAPSDTMDFYKDAEARKRFLSLSAGAEDLPETVVVGEYPQPVDSSDQGSDTVDEYKPSGVWTRQTARIEIDQENDLICGDEGGALRSCLAAKGITNLFYMGVHTNMCVLNRSFGIKSMLKRGFHPCLVRDLTDCMYNPAMPPYVSHDEGTALIAGYIEKFYCPTVESKDIG
ncbi:MAG: isochorismatase family protein [Spirochaetaceae bacterium]|jgi:nicotinamidase-related amidase|nr:isochorismatase family protein [Spirochaetaceae bacterium]